MGKKKHPDLKKDIYLEIKLINFFKMMNKLENKKKEFYFSYLIEIWLARFVQYYLLELTR